MRLCNEFTQLSTSLPYGNLFLETHPAEAGQNPGNSCPDQTRTQPIPAGCSREGRETARPCLGPPGAVKAEASRLRGQPPSLPPGHSLQNPRRVTEKPRLANDSAWYCMRGLRPTSPSTTTATCRAARPRRQRFHATSRSSGRQSESAARATQEAAILAGRPQSRDRTPAGGAHCAQPQTEPPRWAERREAGTWFPKWGPAGPLSSPLGVKNSSY